ncbi:MAG: insecticidal delta-endotoxin Cry8Ea1 family protein [Vicinamibacterales bacterium]
MSGLLREDQAAALRMALSHVLEEAPGWKFDQWGDKGVSQSDFAHALTVLRPRGRKQHPNSVEFGPDSMLGEELPSCPTATEQQVWTICTDLMVVLANVLHEIPFVGWFLASLVEIMWPESNEDPWCAVSQFVEQMIDQKIAEEVKKRNDTYLRNLKGVLDDYLLSVDPAQGNPGWYISQNFQVAEGLFEGNEFNFQEPGYEVLLLTDFAQFANMYLGLLRDAVLYGESWGYTPAAVKGYEDKMTALTATYTEYANHWYQQGLNDLVLPTNVPHQNVQQFNTKNRYIRTMTLGVLDYVAMWPYMNPANYPEPVKVKLTREIYSDAQGTHDNYSGFALDTALRAPLTNLTVWGWDRIDAMKVAYGGVWGPRMGNSSGGSSSPPSGINTTVGANSPHGALMVAYGRSGDILDAAGFTFADKFDTGMMGGGAGGGTAYTWSFQDQIVSKIQIMGVSQYYGSADCIVYGFRYADGY